MVDLRIEGGLLALERATAVGRYCPTPSTTVLPSLRPVAFSWSASLRMFSMVSCLYSERFLTMRLAMSALRSVPVMATLPV